MTVADVAGLRVFGGPSRYVQGAGAFDALGVIARPLGERVVTVVDAGIVGLLDARLTATLAAADLPERRIVTDREVTHAAVDDLVAQIADSTAAVVIGIGGGKAIDLARAASWRLTTPFVTVPTIASNDSPAAMAVAIYDDDHQMIEVVQTGRNPEAVVVDTALIAGAPSRFLSAGVGDAVAKRFEARSCRAVGGANQHGTRSLRLASAVADACYATLRESAAEGVADARRHDVTPELEDTVEATVLMSGLAFENGGLSIAHSFVRGLQAIDGAREAMHGEHVAYGLLVQLALEGSDDDELVDLRDFLRSVDLPTSLADLGAGDPSDDDLRVLARRCVGSPHSHKTPAVVTEATVLRAVEEVERVALL